MLRALRAAMRGANSRRIWPEIARPSMRLVAAINAGPSLDYLDFLNRDDRRIAPAFIQSFLAGDDNFQALVLSQIEIDRGGVQIIDHTPSLRANQFEMSRRLDADCSPNHPFPLHDPFWWRLFNRRRVRYGGSRSSHVRLGGRFSRS